MPICQFHFYVHVDRRFCEISKAETNTPTDPITILAPHNPSINGFNAAGNCRPTDFEALKLWKHRLGQNTPKDVSTIDFSLFENRILNSVPLNLIFASANLPCLWTGRRAHIFPFCRWQAVEPGGTGVVSMVVRAEIPMPGQQHPLRGGQDLAEVDLVTTNETYKGQKV